MQMNRPRFLECDFHTHTDLSGEAQARGFTLRKLFETADALGVRYVGYSEHWHVSTAPDLFLRIREELDALQPAFRVKVFLSAEIDVLNSRGDLAADPAEAARILDYVSVAVSHYGLPGVEQLKKDKIEDTAEMITAVCQIPEVTMLMHPQIAYGRSAMEFDRPITLEEYCAALKVVAERGKVLDYPSVELSETYLEQLGCDRRRLEFARESFVNFTKAAVRCRVRLAPGSDAHNVYWPHSERMWFANNAASLALLREQGFDEDRLWYFENRA